MKKIYFLLLAVLPLFSYAVDYPGNTNTGFGGTIGGGTLSITEDANNIYLSLTKGAGDFNDIAVIYLDNKLISGFNTTSGFGDANDNLRKAISGFDGSNRSILNFTSTFAPNYAIAFSPAGGTQFGGVFQLANGGGGSLIYKGTANLAPINITTSTAYNLSINKTFLGLTAGGNVNFDFVVTYVAASAFRSNEGIGFAFGGPNPGYATLDIPTFQNYPAAVLPISYVNLNGTIRNNLANLTFETSDETGVYNYIIQSSINGTIWSPVATISSKNNTAGSRYAFIDPNVLRGNTYYRIKATSIDGSFAYSKVIILKINGGANVELHGNIVSSNLEFQVANSIASRINVIVYGTDGKVYSKSSIQHNSGVSSYSIPVSSLRSGLYIVKFEGDSFSTSARFLKQ